MIELRVALSLDAVQELAQGNELVLDMLDDGVRLILSCDSDAIDAFKTQIERALLHMLPVGTIPN